MKKLLKLVLGLIIAIVILIVAMVACTSFFANEVDKKLKKGGEVTAVDSKQAKGDKQKNTPKHFAFGDTIKVGDVQLTISKAQNQSPAQYSESKNGNVVVFDVTAMILLSSMIRNSTSISMMNKSILISEMTWQSVVI